MKELIAIPDIHGEYNKLLQLLQKLQYDPEKHQLIFLGDYVDRGPDSRLVLQHIRMMVENHGAIALLGNHERLFINGQECHIGETRLHLINGGGSTLRSYTGFNETLMLEHLAWLKTLPLYYETEEYFFSHAPIPGDTHENWRCILDNEHALTWSYFQPEESAFKIPGKIGVCGHVHALLRDIWEPRIYDHYIYLDAGCGCHPDASLYAYNLTTKEMVKGDS